MSPWPQAWQMTPSPIMSNHPCALAGATVAPARNAPPSSIGAATRQVQAFTTALECGARSRLAARM